MVARAGRARPPQIAHDGPISAFHRLYVRKASTQRTRPGRVVMSGAGARRRTSGSRNRPPTTAALSSSWHRFHGGRTQDSQTQLGSRAPKISRGVTMYTRPGRRSVDQLCSKPVRRNENFSRGRPCPARSKTSRERCERGALDSTGGLLTATLRARNRDKFGSHLKSRRRISPHQTANRGRENWCMGSCTKQPPIAPRRH